MVFRQSFLALIRQVRCSGQTLALNVLGLSVGLAGCLYMLLLAHYESGYDTWIDGSENLYRLELSLRRPDAPPWETALSMPTLGPLLAERLPALKSVTRASQRRRQLVTVGESAHEQWISHVDPNFFALFPLPFLEGEAASALERPEAIVLTRSAAQTLLDNPSTALGRTIRFADGETRLVTGVIEDIPQNSHFDFAVVGSTAALEDFHGVLGNGQFMISAHTYFDIDPDARISELEKTISDVVGELTGLGATNGPMQLSMHLVRVPDIHLKSRGMGQMKPPGDEALVRGFFFVSLLILAVSAVNSTNLNLANFNNRILEVGVRKIAGASWREIAFQFLIEAGLLATLSLLVAVALIYLFIVLGGRVAGIEMHPASVIDGDVLIRATAVLAIVILVGGGYPAVLLARRQPAALFHDNSQGSGNTGRGHIRSFLVTLQFAVTGFLFVSTAIVFGQTRLSLSFERGFSIEDRYVLPGLGNAVAHLEAFRDEVGKLPGVRAASLLSPGVPIDPDRLSSIPANLEGRDSVTVQVGRIATDSLLAATLGVSGIDGSWFTETSQSGNNSLILNRSAMRALGYSQPDEVIGQVLEMRDGQVGKTKGTILGVIDDLRWGSAREKFGPLVYMRLGESSHSLVIHVSRPDLEVALGQVQNLWERFFPDKTFNWTSLEQDYALLAAGDENRAIVFLVFSTVAVLLSCTGLYGITLFFLQRQRREIALRKMFGAENWRIATLLMRRYALPIIIGFLLSVPLAYLYGERWLEQFSPRLSIGVAIFGLSAIVILGLASATVFGLVSRASRQSPAQLFRSE